MKIAPKWRAMMNFLLVGVSLISPAFFAPSTHAPLSAFALPAATSADRWPPVAAAVAPQTVPVNTTFSVTFNLASAATEDTPVSIAVSDPSMVSSCPTMAVVPAGSSSVTIQVTSADLTGSLTISGTTTQTAAVTVSVVD